MCVNTRIAIDKGQEK